MGGVEQTITLLMKTEPVSHPNNGNASPFADFNGLHSNLPMYSERSLRGFVRAGVIPSIVLPGGRKRLFHLPTVEAALRRRQTGGQ
jgi:hypothetical protein